VEASDAGSDAHSVFRPLLGQLRRVWAGFLDGILKAYVDGSVRSFSERDGLVGGMISSIYEDGSHRSGLGRRTA